MSGFTDAIGVFFMGFIISVFAMFFLWRLEKFNIASFSTFIGVLFGALIIKFIGKSFEYWWWLYPVGLTVGYFFITIMKAYGPKKWIQAATFRAQD